ncbi:glycosyltransferase involved in cell wall biosynthesis [Yoonia maricola]|uniref:Glycosyltransferase involved in cell wall biosynthesis n=1 Tax=Yoonia maricola TaxID=420999 RepID=A0A2M8W2H6_9RHOB|nr:glycosyltransferase family 2 protein [Yoonia maricola]PJI85110.1 glycosyltransferase involved in cell wall biosynthesis [Yoonia maricola]
MTQLTVIILTFDEAKHIARAIASVRDLADRILVVDSGSTDATVRIASDLGAEVLYHPWTNHAAQFNWALDQIAGQPGWVLRLDADEVVTTALAVEISAGLPDVAGCYVGRGIKFMGQLVRHGGVFPVPTLRLFRNGRARCEARWMDEHILVDGPTANLRGQIIDDNRNPLDWWVAKHNGYASGEVVDILNREHGFLPVSHDLPGRGSVAAKRWIKLHLYRRLPAGLRAGAYFLYRYILRGGFRDGAQARAFHVLQGFWYRYLVDVKLAEVKRHMAATGVAPAEAIHAVLDIDVTPPRRASKKVAA